MDSDDATVLIVEDEESLATLHDHHLQDKYDTEIAFNAGEALVKLSPDVDLVLLDRRMPGMSGDELLSHIGDWEANCQVIMVTAVDPDVELVNMPIAGYLTKPVSKEEILDATEQALLLREYESLITEYYEAKRKHALLISEFSTNEMTDNDEFAELESRVSSLKEQIESIIDSFPDDEFAKELQEIHNPTSASE